MATTAPPADSDPAELDREYNARAAIPDAAAILQRWADESTAVRRRCAGLYDLRYGSTPAERLDFFPAAAPDAPLFVFLHGGYWRSLDKADHAFVAPPLTARGIAVAVANYDLCPNVSIATIVEESARAVAWLAREGRAHGAGADRIVVGGHSAGGHLAAMMLARDWRADGFASCPVAAGLSLSGVHDLRPLVRFSGNADFKLDDAEAARLSPVLLPPTTGASLAIAVGGAETDEFLRQSRLMWDAWPANRPKGMAGPLVVPGKHHFDVVVEHADAGSALTRATLALF